MSKEKSTLTTKGLSATRWSARHDACRALNEYWFAVFDCLQSLDSDETQKAGTRLEPRGLLSKLRRLETAFMAQFWGTILMRLNQISNMYVQSVDADVFKV